MTSNPPGTEVTRAVRTIRTACQNGLGDWLALTAELVAIDSGADAPEGIQCVQQVLARRLERLGATVTWQMRDAVSHLHASLPGGRRRVAVLGHADTVFARGTADQRPWRMADGIARGPGVVDMKGGLVLALAALELAADHGLPLPRVEFVVVGDEESRTGPPPFMEELTACDACLVLECGRPGNGVVTARKAGVWTQIACHGRAAHAGVAPGEGRNAIVALCRDLVRIAALDGWRDGVSLTVGTIQGGTAPNVVPEHACARLDLRAWHPEDLEATLERMRGGAPAPPVCWTLTTDTAWPAMAPEPARRLLRQYCGIAGELGLTINAMGTGGMSDGNWVAARGVPTLDGLGPIGGADHGPDEYLEVASWADRTALLAGLLAVIEASGAL